MKNFFQPVIPFIAFGITLFLLIAGIVILSYILIFGAFIGLVLFAIAWLREKISAKKTVKKPNPVEHKGRVIDHDDL